VYETVRIEIVINLNVDAGIEVRIKSQPQFSHVLFLFSVVRTSWVARNDGFVPRVRGWTRMGTVVVETRRCMPERKRVWLHRLAGCRFSF